MGHAGFGARFGLVALILVSVHLGTPTAREADAQEQPRLSRIYPGDAVARDLLQEGTLRSSTIGSLAQTIARSDWYVVVEAKPCPGKPTLYGCLAHVVSPFLDGMSLRIFINPMRRSRHDTLATLGHELQHAVEVIQAGDVRDTAGLTELFRRLGTVSRRDPFGRNSYETEQAERVTSTVLKELRAADTTRVARAPR